jgi:hypothetical protein
MTPKKTNWIALTVILLLLQSGSPASASEDPQEPEVIALEPGDPAPFPGFLFPPKRAMRLGAKLEACEFQLKVDKDLFQRTLDLRVAGQAKADEIRIDAEKAKVKLLTEQLEAANKAATREWWEKPEVWFWTGIVAGVGITVGAIWGVGQLRPAIPEA